MNKAWTSAMILMLVLSLSLTVPAIPARKVRAEVAEQGAISGAQAPEQPEVEVEKPPQTPVEPSGEEPIEAPSGEHSEAPSEPTKAPDAVAEPTGEPADAPSEEPTEAPSEEPTKAPTAEPLAEPTETPTEVPTEAPTEAPVETAIPAAAYRISPAEATFQLGSEAALEFAVSPADAPFAGIENVESAFEGGVVMVATEALNALGAGEHILNFLFSDGVIVQVKLTALEAAPKLMAKGPLSRLQVNGHFLTDEELNGSASGANWAWDAQSGVLTLSGYQGGGIFSDGVLRVRLADGTENSITSGENSALSCGGELILSGGGSLTATSTASNGTAITAGAKLTIESGRITAKGGRHGFASLRSIIVVNGGTLEAKGEEGKGAGFYVDNSDYFDPCWVAVNGADVSVDGFSTGISSLRLSSGSVQITNCGSGITSGLSATGGSLSIRNVKGNAVSQVSGVTTLSSCTVDISECGGMGIGGDAYVSVGKGATVNVQAKSFALFGNDEFGEIAIDKTAKLDLYGAPQAIYARKTTINKQKYTGKYIHVVIEGGKVLTQESSATELTIGGSKYDGPALVKDLVGEGWKWTAKDRTIALAGYDGGEIVALGKAFRLTLSGNNKASGTVSAPGLTITGTGALAATKIMSSGAGLEIQSGTVSAQCLVTSGFALSGGSFEILKRADAGSDSTTISCSSFKMTGGTLVADEDGPYSDPLHSWGTIAISGGTILMTGISGDNLFAEGDVKISGGTIKLTELPLTYGGSGIVSRGNITVTGGNIEIDKGGPALSTEYKTISISGKPNLNLKSYNNSAFFAKTVKIAGKTYSKRYSIAVIVKGKLIDEDKLEPDLEIDGQKFFMKELNAEDYSGEGWFWSAKQNTLTLNGYDGGFIWTDRNMTLRLSAGTSNSAEAGADYSGASLFAKGDLTLAGTGRWKGSIYASGNLKISGSRGVTADYIRADFCDLTIENARVRVNGNINADDFSISSGDVQARKVDVDDLSLKKSTLEATDSAYEYDPAIDCGGNLSASDGLILCQNLEADGKVRLSGTPIFFWYALQDGEIPGLPGGTVIWILYNKSVTISRDMTLPGTRNYVIPSGSKMKIASGKKLYVYGTLWYSKGSLTGKVVGRSHSGSIEITGSAEVARGKSVTLSAKVLPISSGVDVSQAVAWTSGNPRRVAVSDKGVVTATASAAVGDTAVITCTALDDSGISQTLTVTVKEPTKKIVIKDGNGVAVTKLTAQRSVGSFTMSASVDPLGASTLVKWTSSNKAIASVDPVTGVVTPLRKGTVAITCTAQDGTGVKATLKLTVQ